MLPTGVVPNLELGERVVEVADRSDSIPDRREVHRRSFEAKGQPVLVSQEGTDVRVHRLDHEPRVDGRTLPVAGDAQAEGPDHRDERIAGGLESTLELLPRRPRVSQIP